MSNNPPQRRWYQFSLRALLAVMLVSCFGFAWIGVRLHRARDNRARMAATEKATKQAAAWIEASHGTVTSEYKKLRSQTWLERQFEDPGGVDDPVGVLFVTNVLLSDTKSTDGVLEHMRGLTNLQRLRLDGTDATDAGLQHLKGMTTLTHLHIGPTWLTIFKQQDVTDKGLECLTGLTNLQVLFLDNTYVTDEGVRKLKQALPDCEIINDRRGR